MRLPKDPEQQLNAIVERLPSPRVIAFCRQNMREQNLTIAEVEAISEDIPKEMQADIEAGLYRPPHDEDIERIHRRLFIALNWRNN